MMEGASYKAPAISVFILESEGALCASTQMFEEDDNNTPLFGW